MNLLRCATHTVLDAEAAGARFARWLDYRIVERGHIDPELAALWGAPASASRAYTLCQPASGAEIFLRFIEGDPVPSYEPIRSFGWAAMEICVQRVLEVATRLERSPFAVIGPPNRIAGLATIHPMQVRGPDKEIVYFTEILTDARDSGLPKAAAPIDTLFILVLACADLPATARWFAVTLGIVLDDPMPIRYTMISRAFGVPMDTPHEIMIGRHGGHIFLELDQYPDGAVPRPCAAGALPPGTSICTLLHPKSEAGIAPSLRPLGLLYAGQRVSALRTPEGALVEVLLGT